MVFSVLATFFIKTSGFFDAWRILPAIRPIAVSGLKEG
jgi:hypothetical protein